MADLILGQADLTYSFVKIFKKLKIPYLLTGSLAVSYYGVPRATHDVDFIVEIKTKNVLLLLKEIKKLDPSFSVFEKEIQNALRKTSQFNLFHPDTGIKTDFWIAKQTEFEKNKFQRAKKMAFQDLKINVISSEDLILNKLLWSKEIRSEKHLNDCVGILKIQGEKIDIKYLKVWAIKLDIESLLEEIILLSSD